ncbi:MAG: hypothetical protein QOE09_925 [Ilumatobacteraceae bacterium]|jgi:hypothetical protein
MKPNVLYHFSEDPNIARFMPHVPRTNPTHPPAVWAIDLEHEPLYWFPRDCPRVTVWPRNEGVVVEFQERFVTSARRLHAIESGWLERMRTAQVFRYAFDSEGFEPWEPADGQWISAEDVTPIAVESVGDLLLAHSDAGIELRLAPSLWPLHDAAIGGEFDFSVVRMHNAQPRSPS